MYFPFVQALSTIGGALVLFAAASEVHSGALTAGSLIAYLLYVDPLFSPVQQMSQVFDGYQQANVGPAADQGPAADADQHAAGRQPGPAGPAARRGSSCATCTSATPGQRTGGASAG